MNTVKNIQALNKRELENVVAPSASWHTDYRDTAYIFVGGLSFDLTEGDLETIFSQYGVPTWIKLQRDKETGKSKGFAFLKYEDQRSCDLAVDNIGGATILGRIIRVDHTRYKRKEGEEEEDEKYNIRFEEPVKQSGGRGSPSDRNGESTSKPRSKTKAEKELEELIRKHDDDDPMKEYLINEKREEIAAELEALDNEKSRPKKHHRHHHDSHRERDRDHDRDGKDRERRKHRHRSRSRERRRRSTSPEHSREKRRDR